MSISLSKLKPAECPSRNRLPERKPQVPAHVELRPEAVALAKRLHRASPKTGKRMSLRKIAAASPRLVISTSVGSHSTQKACAAWLTRSADCDGATITSAHWVRPSVSWTSPDR